MPILFLPQEVLYAYIYTLILYQQYKNMSRMACGSREKDERNVEQSLSG